MDSIPYVSKEEWARRIARERIGIKNARRITRIHIPLNREEFLIFKKSIVDGLLQGDFTRALVGLDYLLESTACGQRSFYNEIESIKENDYAGIIYSRERRPFQSPLKSYNARVRKLEKRLDECYQNHFGGRK